MPDNQQSGSDPKQWTILKILDWTQSYFLSHSIDSPRLTAEILLAHSLGLKRLDLYLQYDRPLEKKELSQFKSLIRQRAQGRPVAYITGTKGFYDSEFEVTKDVLIPRPDTELLVEETCFYLQKMTENGFRGEILELGTGSGAILISCARACPGHVCLATDISPGALQVAKKNADRIVPGRIEFSAGDWFKAVPAGRTFDLIVSNPPYIPSPDIDGLQVEIKNHEPRAALDGGFDGLDCYRMILGGAAAFLKPGGLLLLEIGFDQRTGLERLSKEISLYQPPVFKKDLSGYNRVVILKKLID